ncbi:MAG TPA: phage/plasmid primase, P4 family, partial [Flavisolibacter sp.]|nr:phage/plasmid primase, P4 family [Flavisolibacter sp.]
MNLDDVNLVKAADHYEFYENIASGKTTEDIIEIVAPQSDNLSDTSIAITLQLDESKIVPDGLAHNDVLEKLIQDLEPVNFHEKAGLSEDESVMRKHYVIECIDQILDAAQNKNWSLCMSDGFVYVYNGSFWKQLTKQELKHFLGKAAQKLGVKKYEAKHYSFHNELLSQFYTSAFLPKPEKKVDEVLINFSNGTFVITPEKQELRGFDKDDFLTYQLDFPYDDSAKAPLFNQFIERVLPNKSLQDVLAEYMSYVFIKQGTLKLEKSLILYGSGANGKSVLFDIVMALLGQENVSNFSLQSLTNENGYYRAMLKDKLLNYASEISPKMDSTIFKQLVSGEPVEVRQIYGEPYIMTDYAKLMFNTNTLPANVEQTEAFFRRFIILPFEVTIPEEERDPELAKKIIDKELSGIFNWVLQGLERLLNNKGFTSSEAINNTVAQYRKESDTVH